MSSTNPAEDRADRLVLPPPPPPHGADDGGAPPPPGPRRGRALVAALVAAAVLVVGGIGVSFSTPWASTPAPAASTPIRGVPQPSSVTGTDRGIAVQAIARRVAPAVVDVNTTIASFSGSGVAGRAAGSGIILTSSGEVLTNNHVIQNASTIRVFVAGRGTYAARVLGADPSADVALLQIEGVSGLPTAALADSSSLTVGEEVVAIGNALGQGGSPTVTAGTITALHRSIVARSDVGGAGEPLHNLIQTDASISPGDSGGPLVNAAGQVVGMITAGAQSDGSSSTDVAFAIPTNDAVSVVDRIRAGHEAGSLIIGEAGYLGIEAASVDAATAARLGLPDGVGVVVAGVLPGGPAAEAGIAPGSVITSVDGRTITSIDALGTALHSHAPGEQVRVTWVDATGTHTTTVRLVSGPAV